MRADEKTAFGLVEVHSSEGSVLNLTEVWTETSFLSPFKMYSNKKKKNDQKLKHKESRPWHISSDELLKK